MKIMVISDLHNDENYTKAAIDLFKKESFDKLFVLGDIGIDSIRLLNPLHEKILAVKGNCDGYDLDDVARFNLPYINYDYDFSKFIVMSHGNFYSDFNYDKPYDIFLEGHTHMSLLVKKKNGQIVANPGSLSDPRDYSHSYLVMDEKGLRVIDINSNEVVHFLEY